MRARKNKARVGIFNLYILPPYWFAFVLFVILFSIFQAHDRP